MVPGHVRPQRGDQAEVAPQTSADPIPTVELSAIMGTGREAVILHNGERYRLRVTANDKLILTK
jgi:hemin uptake protein HemP